jgi:CRISPR-associated protein (TIGR03984 family)
MDEALTLKEPDPVYRVQGPKATDVKQCAPADLAGLKENPTAWLENQAATYDFRYLLAHQDDGVIWGRFDAGNNGAKKLILSEGIGPSPRFDLTRLQQLRAFGPTAELLIWRSWDGWRGRRIEDGRGSAREYYDDQQILWGTEIDNDLQAQAQASALGFTAVREGQGLRHIVPVQVREEDFKHTKIDGYRPLRLLVRHYLEADKDGFYRVNLSRLRGLEPDEKGVRDGLPTPA